MSSELKDEYRTVDGLRIRYAESTAPPASADHHRPQWRRPP